MSDDDEDDEDDPRVADRQDNSTKVARYSHESLPSRSSVLRATLNKSMHLTTSESSSDDDAPRTRTVVTTSSAQPAATSDANAKPVAKAVAKPNVADALPKTKSVSKPDTSETGAHAKPTSKPVSKPDGSETGAPSLKPVSKSDTKTSNPTPKAVSVPVTGTAVKCKDVSGPVSSAIVKSKSATRPDGKTPKPTPKVSSVAKPLSERHSEAKRVSAGGKAELPFASSKPMPKALAAPPQRPMPQATHPKSQSSKPTSSQSSSCTKPTRPAQVSNKRRRPDEEEEESEESEEDDEDEEESASDDDTDDQNSDDMSYDADDQDELEDEDEGSDRGRNRAKPQAPQPLVVAVDESTFAQTLRALHTQTALVTQLQTDKHALETRVQTLMNQNAQLEQRLHDVSNVDLKASNDAKSVGRMAHKTFHTMLGALDGSVSQLDAIVQCLTNARDTVHGTLNNLTKHQPDAQLAKPGQPGPSCENASQ